MYLYTEVRHTKHLNTYFSFELHVMFIFYKSYFCIFKNNSLVLIVEIELLVDVELLVEVVELLVVVVELPLVVKLLFAVVMH